MGDKIAILILLNKKMAEVTIYTTPYCPYCKASKKYFDDHNIKYTEIDVASDEKRAQEMIERSGQMAVPVIFINRDGKEDMVLGFNQSEFEKLLGIK